MSKARRRFLASTAVGIQRPPTTETFDLIERVTLNGKTLYRGDKPLRAGDLVPGQFVTVVDADLRDFTPRPHNTKKQRRPRA